MTDNNHPITPPPELVQQWFAISCGSSASRWKDIVTQAARWGADQQLEQCEKYWMTHGISPEGVVAMRYALRPKPPSLKEQALEQLDSLHSDLKVHGLGTNTDTIRRALESLPS